jgi:two-component system, LuxR family, sensor kinase FixL
MPLTDAIAPVRRANIGGLTADRLRIAAGYCLGYIALDWVSYIHPVAPYDITPWNPPTGLSFALILLYGRAYLPLLFVVPFLADLVLRGRPLPWDLEFACAATIGMMYAGALYFLTASRAHFDPALGAVGDLLRLLAVTVTSALAVALGYIGLLTLGNHLPPDQFVANVMRFWIGDIIGVMTFTPFLLVWGTAGLPRLKLRQDGLVALAIVLAVALIVALPGSSHLQLFYLLFLPIGWLALKAGMGHVAGGLMVAQIALIVGLQYMQEKAGTVISFQILMLVLATTGLLMGAAIGQQRRAEAQLRQQQEALAKVSRIGSMGALGAAIAHEVNQPLSAIATYVDILQQELAKSPVDVSITAEAARKTAAQVTRAADIIRRLREMIRLGQSEAGPCDLRDLLDETHNLIRDDLSRQRGRLKVVLPADLPDVMADRVQVEQVFVNLIRNGLDAMAGSDDRARFVTVEARAGGNGYVTISVHDEGPGFPAHVLNGALVAFSSTKPDGMGIGLMICRSIVEAHGGRLWIDPAGPGGTVLFTLKAMR